MHRSRAVLLAAAVIFVVVAACAGDPSPQSSRSLSVTGVTATLTSSGSTQPLDTAVDGGSDLQPGDDFTLQITPTAQVALPQVAGAVLDGESAPGELILGRECEPSESCGEGLYPVVLGSEVDAGTYHGSFDADGGTVEVTVTLERSTSTAETSR